MRPFISHTGIAASLLHPNIDTDAIIPSREIKTVGKDGLADGLFANWRYSDVATRKPLTEFVLNREDQIGTSILLAGRNFGCGSSREHAAWALAEWGIRAVIAPSFGAIFFENCIRNGILPVVLDESEINVISEAVASDPQARLLKLDLQAREICGPGDLRFEIKLSEEDREQLLTGLDPISRTLQQHVQVIESFEQQDALLFPWLYR